MTQKELQGIEIGSKVGLARNLKSLQWFDNIDMNTFFPRMYNLANPWEMQDFVEDFVFTAGHVEVMRFTRYADAYVAVLTSSTRTHMYSRCDMWR